MSNLKKRIVFAEGEEERAIKSALIIQNSNLGKPILIGREKYIKETAKKIGFDGITNLEIHNAALSEKNNIYSDFLFKNSKEKDIYIETAKGWLTKIEMYLVVYGSDG